MSKPAPRLKLAIQSKGRIAQSIPSFFKAAGLKFSNLDRQLTSRCQNFPLELLFLRHSDIPIFVQDGAADLGIVGTDLLQEKKYPVKEILPLGLSKSKLCVAVPEQSSIQNIQELKGKKIATHYQRLTKKFFKEQNIDVEIIYMKGSVEIAPNLKMTEAISDLVGTGTTLKANRLKIITTITQTQATLIANKKALFEQKEIIDNLIFRFESVINARGKKTMYFNLPRNSLPQLKNLNLGLSGPTISPIEQLENLVAIMIVIDEQKTWSIMKELKKIGASGILLMNIERLVN